MHAARAAGRGGATHALERPRLGHRLHQLVGLVERAGRLASGSHHDIPADVPGSAYYVPPGSPSQVLVDAAAAGEAPRAKGFKVVGAFKGDAD